MRSVGWTFAVVTLGMGCAGSKGSSGPGPDLHKIVPIKYDVRPEMAPDNYWGGWTDGTVQYLYDETNPPIPADISSTTWPGQMLITTIDVATAKKHAEFDDASFEILVSSPDFPKGIPLDGILHAQGLGYTAVGGRFSYDINGAGEDLTMYAEGGFVFYAKAGVNPDAPAAATLTFSSSDFSPVMLPAGAPPDTSAHCGNPGYGACYDAPTISVSLSSFWRQFVIPFQTMHQAGVGYPVPDFFEKRGLLVDPRSGWGPFVGFELPNNVPFDFWLAGFGYYTKANYDKVAAN
jgi:hypothetical protein